MSIVDLEESVFVRKAQEDVKYLLKNNLADDLHFHGLLHTELVVDAALQIGQKENIKREEQEILKLAAWFHDTGFIYCCEGHEIASVNLAASRLEFIGYPEEKIRIVESCILSTKLPQNPQNKLQAILCDADLYHLSQENYWELNERLRKEISCRQNEQISDKQWYLSNLKFLTEHAYHTNYGKEVLEKGKKKNINKNLQLLEAAIK